MADLKNGLDQTIAYCAEDGKSTMTLTGKGQSHFGAALIEGSTGLHEAVDGTFVRKEIGIASVYERHNLADEEIPLYLESVSRTDLSSVGIAGLLVSDLITTIEVPEIHLCEGLYGWKVSSNKHASLFQSQGRHPHKHLLTE